MQLQDAVGEVQEMIFPTLYLFILFLVYFVSLFSCWVCLVRVFYSCHGFFFPFQLPKFTTTSFDLPPQIFVIASQGLHPSAAKGKERPFPFREGPPTLPIYTISSCAVLCSVAKGDFRIDYFMSSLPLSCRAVLGRGGHGKAGGCPEHHPAKGGGALCCPCSRALGSQRSSSHCWC